MNVNTTRLPYPKDLIPSANFDEISTDNLDNKQNVNPRETNEIFHHRSKERHKIRKNAKLYVEML